MDKYKNSFKRLTFAFWANVVCFILPIIADKHLMDSILIVWGLVWIGAGFTYLQSLGTLAAGANKSVLAWVGGTMLTGPIGYIVSFVRMKVIAVQQGWD